jgi:hypothetical protein
LVCEERIYEVEVISNLLVPQISKTILVKKLQIVIEKTRMYCINCHRKTHNVETCKIKRKEDHVPIVSKVTTQHIKVQRLVRYSFHICREMGHKIIDCPKYNDM